MIALNLTTSPKSPRNRLPAGELFAAPIPAGTTLELLEGLAWVTLPHDPEDHILAAGQSLTAPHAGTLLLQPLRAPATFRLTPQ